MASLNQELDDIFERAIRKHAMGRQIDHGVSYSPMMDKDGQPTTVVVVVLRMKSVIIGEFITTSFFVSTPVPTFEQIDPVIADAIKDLELAHAKQQDVAATSESLTDFRLPR